MREQKNRVEELAAGYWSASLTECEEQELRQLLATESNLSEELEALKMMLGGFEELATEFEDGAQVQSLPTVEAKRGGIMQKIITFAAAAAVLIVGVITDLKTEETIEAEVYCYINGEPITDIDVALEQTKYFKSLSALSETITTLETIMLN